MISREQLRRWAADHEVRLRLAERHYLDSWVRYGLATIPDAARCVLVGESALDYWLPPAAAVQTPRITVQISTTTPEALLITALDRVRRKAGIEYTGFAQRADRSQSDNVFTETATQSRRFAVQFPSLSGGVQRTVITIVEPAPASEPPVERTHQLLDGAPFHILVTHPTVLATTLLAHSVRRPRAREYYLLYQLSQATTPAIEWNTALRLAANQCDMSLTDLSDAIFSPSHRNQIATQWQHRLSLFVSSPPACETVWTSLQATVSDHVD